MPGNTVMPFGHIAMVVYCPECEWEVVELRTHNSSAHS